MSRPIYLAFAIMLLGAVLHGVESPAQAAEEPVAEGQGLFLIITDIHFNPFADPNLATALASAPVAQWQSILSGSIQTGFAQYGSDSNFPLMQSALGAAQTVSDSRGVPYDFVLYPGDYIARNFYGDFGRYIGGGEQALQAFVIKTMQFVSAMLEQTFQVPVYGTIGNRDAICGNYMIAPDSAMLPAVGATWGVLADRPAALESFSIGGSYALPHPVVPDHTLIVLNSVFWSTRYANRCGQHDVDPGAAQMAWLEWQLYKARLSGQDVSLMMHIPPGIDAHQSATSGTCHGNVTPFWHEVYAERFLALTRSYRDILRNSFAGHTHMDDFRVIADDEGAPYLLTRITPAVSPVFGNNPAFTTVRYDRTSGDLLDYATYYLTNLASAGKGEEAKWSLEYEFGGAYGFGAYDPANLQTLAEQIQSDEAVRAKYRAFYAAETSAEPPITDRNWGIYACAQTALTVKSFEACYCKDGQPK